MWYRKPPARAHMATSSRPMPGASYCRLWTPFFEQFVGSRFSGHDFVGVSHARVSQEFTNRCDWRTISFLHSKPPNTWVAASREFRPIHLRRGWAWLLDHRSFGPRADPIPCRKAQPRSFKSFKKVCFATAVMRQVACVIPQAETTWTRRSRLKQFMTKE